jgi:hypothetical protein
MLDELGRNRSWTSEILSWNLPGGTKENHKDFSHRGHSESGNATETERYDFCCERLRERSEVRKTSVSSRALICVGFVLLTSGHRWRKISHVVSHSVTVILKCICSKISQTEHFVQFLSFWTLSSVLFSYLKHDVSEIWFCLRLQVKSYYLCRIDRTSPCLQCKKNQ